MYMCIYVYAHIHHDAFKISKLYFLSEREGLGLGKESSHVRRLTSLYLFCLLNGTECLIRIILIVNP